jgi:dTDP-4-dehydrorhamnose reductase
MPDEFDYRLIHPSDVVLLTAAISAPDICAQEYARAWGVNVTGTSRFIRNVIDRGGRVIFFSSDTVYGEKDDVFDERAYCNPAGEYAIMKHEVEKQFFDNPLASPVLASLIQRPANLIRASAKMEFNLKEKQHD